MKREYKDSGEDNNVEFFVGKEVENTLVKGANTLFVVGEPDIELVARRLTQYIGDDEITHIYFGANQSFKVSTYEDMDEWLPTIQHFLTLDYWCTLDLDVALVGFIQDSMLIQYSQFIPMISVKIPSAKDLGYNAVIKIDDADFDYSNNGVWCHQLHDLMSYDKFTSWYAYRDDTVVSENG